jgi:hypothetical protein
MIFNTPDLFTRRTLPVPGVGAGLPVVFSNAYMRPRASKATPSTVVSPSATMSICPLGVIL